MVKKISVFKADWVRTSPSERAPLNEGRLSTAEAEALGAYLENCTAIMHTTNRARDVLADREDKVVPLTVRTDGEYVWTGPVAYYVKQYAVAPDQEFIDYVKARNFELRIPSESEIKEAISLMRGGK